MYGSARRFGLGDAMDDVAIDAAGEYAQDPQLARLHQLALLIAQLRNEFNAELNDASNADADFNAQQLTVIGQQIAGYLQQFNALRSSINQQTVNQNALHGVDASILAIGTWANQVLQALPSTIAAVPNALVDSLRNIGTNAGKDLAQVLVVPALLLLGAIAIARQAERTRAGRALVGRLR